MPGLVNYLKNTFPETYWNTNDPNFYLFKQFIIDHKDLIKENSEIHNFTVEEMYFQRYKLTEYLMSLGLGPDLTWIVLWINDLNDQTEFKDLLNILVPDRKYMQDLIKYYYQYIRDYTATAR